MTDLILLVDVGNSSVCMSQLSGNEVGEIWRGKPEEALNKVSAFSKDCRHALLASVVPRFNGSFVSQIACPVTLLRPDTVPRLTLCLDAPEQVGVDRLMCALGVLDRFEHDVLIVDSGTAVTFCLVSSDGRYFGGSIFPGMGIASKALNDYTAQIPLIHVEKRSSVIGSDTKSAVESGLYHGYVAMINGVISRYRSEWPEPLSVVGTGGGLDVLSSELVLDAYEPDLIFEGLKACVRELAL